MTNNIYKQLIFILLILCSCTREYTQQPVKTPDAYEYPLSDSLLTELNDLYRKAGEAHDYSALEQYTGALVRHYNSMNDYKPAFFLVNDYLNILSASGDSALMPPAYYYVGVVYFNCGLPNYSIDYFLKTVEYPMDERMQCKVYYAMGENSRNLVKNNGLNPMEYYRKAEAIARNLNDSALISRALFGQSQMLFDSMGAYKVEKMSDGMKDSLARSTHLLEDAVAYSAKNPDPVYLAGLSLNYAAMGMYDKALSYREAIESYRNVPMFTSLTFNCMAAIGNYMKDYDEVIRLGKEAYKFAEENGRKFDMHHAADILAYAYKAKGDYKNAVLNLEIVRRSEDEMKKTESDMEVLALQVKYDLKVKEQFIARQRTQLIWSIGIIGLTVAGLLIIVYFYRKTRMAYRELVRKNQQWANVVPASTTDMDAEQVAAEEKTTPAPPDTMDRAIMEEIEKLTTGGLYKDSNLSMDLLAEKTSLNPAYISKAINRCTGKNFKTYINEHRVKESIRILSDKSSEDVSIDELAFESGFNDRKTFYRVFKKVTGLSPTDFKKNMMQG